MTPTHHAGQSDAAPGPSIPSTHRCIDFQDDTVLVFDSENPERWIQAADGVSLDDYR